MPEYVGSAQVLRWVYSGGTVALTPDLRSVTFTPSVDIIDATAGQDTSKQKLVSLRDAEFSATLVHQTGTATDYYASLQEGTGGTLLWSPYGTATSSRLITMPAICMGAPLTTPYSDVAEMSPSWTLNGTVVYGAH